MARPKKSRKVCRLPKNKLFSPLEGANQEDTIVMSIDEYETIRLIDSIGYTQEECAKQMQIARTTVQWVYNSARKKVAEALVNGKCLLIEGGEFALCKQNDPDCTLKEITACACEVECSC